MDEFQKLGLTSAITNGHHGPPNTTTITVVILHLSISNLHGSTTMTTVSEPLRLYPHWLLSLLAQAQPWPKPYGQHHHRGFVMGFDLIWACDGELQFWWWWWWISIGVGFEFVEGGREGGREGVDGDIELVVKMNLLLEILVDEAFHGNKKFNIFTKASYAKAAKAIGEKFVIECTPKHKLLVCIIAHPNHAQFLKKKIEMFDEMSLVVG
ncbi:hypothetical protein CFP56_039572 [Quercus suber]|uniref:Uncharacterized protein n=1 Tax=Quercus suber TaxID=58331 RepID=A0AAW0J0C6_QUESU